MSLYKFKPFVFERCESKVTNAKSVSPCPKPRSGHRIVCNESHLYSFGGYNPEELDMPGDDVWAESKPLFKELWKYNFATKVWNKLLCQGNMPDALASNAVLLDGGTIMIYGGTGWPFSEESSNHLHLCNLSEKTMQLFDVQGQLPAKQYGQAVALDGPYMYVVGGTTGFDYSADIHRLDFRLKKWEEVHICRLNSEVEPKGRYRHELAFDGTRLYVLGGGTSFVVFGFEEISAYNLKLRQWEKHITRPDTVSNPPGFPSARRCHSSVQMHGNSPHDMQVFITGGCDGMTSYDDTWRLDIHTLQWTHLQFRLPYPIYFHSAAIKPSGRMYIFGGIEKMENENEKRTADMHAAWMCIPKLSTMCWEAVVHYNSNLELFSKDQLLKLGIPLKYVQFAKT